MKRLAMFAAFLFAVGCGEEVAPATFVDKLRVLSVTAEPPDLRPGEATQLSALVVDPTRPGKKNTLVWLACDPDPKDLSRSSCSDVSTLSDPGAFTNDAGGLPPGVRAIGFGDLAFYQAPADTFASLDAADPRRVQGAVAQVLLIAVAAEVPANPTQEQRDALFAKVKSKEIASLLTLTRLRVTEDPQRNHNPTVARVEVDGQPLPEGATMRLFADKDTPLSFTAAEGDFEQYDQLEPDRTTAQKTEKIIAALYSTTGRFEQERLELGSNTPESFQPPDGRKTDPKPDNRRGTMWVVLRDTRGGQSFAELPLFLCDPSLPAPELSTVTPTSGVGDRTQRISFTGKNLASVLDVTLGGKALIDLQYDGARDVLEGTVPSLAAGDYPLQVRGEHCADGQSSLTFHVQ